MRASASKALRCAARMGLLASFLVSGAGACLASDPGAKREQRNELERLERAWQTAQLAGDAAAMDQVLADDYVGVTLQGKVTTKLQQLRRMEEQATRVRRLDLSAIKFRVQGDIAVVTMRARVVGSGGSGPVDGRYRCRQVFRQLPDGGWAMTNFEAHPVHGDHDAARTS